MSQQGYRQASVRAVTGSAETYEGDWHRLFDISAIPVGQFNERLLRWINQQLIATYTDINEAMQAFATAQGATNWSSMGTFNAWTPPSLAGSILGWWDAERADKLTLSGSSVTTWTDIIGGYPATQATAANKPTYGAATFNSRPGVTFDGSNDELTLASVPFPTGSSPSEIWALVDTTATGADATTRRILAYGGTVNSNDTRHLARVTDNTNSRASAAVGTGAASVSAVDLTDNIAGRHVLRGVFSATSVSVSADGGSATSAAAVPATATSRTRIGASTFGAGFWQGQIAALLVTSPLTTAQAAQLMAYLKARGGVA